MKNSSRDLAVHSKVQVSLGSSYLDRGLRLQEDIESKYFHCTHAEIVGDRLLLLEWPIVERVSKKNNEVRSTTRMRKFALHSFSLEGDYIDSNYFSPLDPHGLELFIDEAYSSLNIVDTSLILYETSGFLELDDDPTEEVIAHIFDLSGTLKALLTNSERIETLLPSDLDVAKNVDSCMDLPSEFRFRKLGKYSVSFFNKDHGATMYLYNQLPWLNSTSAVEPEDLCSYLQAAFRLTRKIQDAHCDESGLWILEEDGLLSYQKIPTNPENGTFANVAFTHCEGQLLQFYLAGTAEVLALNRTKSADTLPLMTKGEFSYFFLDNGHEIGQVIIHLQEMISEHVVRGSRGYSYSIENLSSTYDLSSGLLSFSAQTSLGIPCVGTVHLRSGRINAFFPEIPKARRLWSEEATTVWVDD